MRGWLRAEPGWGLFAAYLLLALLLRAPGLLFSEVNWDEGLYRLIAGRLLDGVAPYGEIWDRKPVGLFVLLAAIERVAGPGVPGLRLAVSALVALSALLLARLAGCLAPRAKPIGPAAGAVLVLGSLRNGGDGCNTELLLMPFALGGMVLTLRGRWFAGGVLLGAAAMVKQVAVLDAAAVAALVLWRGVAPGRAAAWLAGAAVPAAAAALWYAAIGRLRLFVDVHVAGAVAGAGRGAGPGAWSSAPLQEYWPLLALLVFVAVWAAGGRGGRALRPLLAAAGVWLAAGAFGVLAVGRLIDHEAIALLPALSLAGGAAAWVLAARWRWAGPALAGALLLWAGLGPFADAAEVLRRRAAEPHWGDATAGVAARIAGRVGPGELYVASRMVELYRATGTAPPPTRFPFVPHLWLPYAPAEAAGEMARILATRPRMVVVDDEWLPRPGLPSARFAPPLRALHRALALDYAREVGVAGAQIFVRK